MLANFEFRITYSDDVGRVMRNANLFVRYLNYDSIGTEHILHGMLTESFADLTTVFEAMHTDVAACQAEINMMSQPWPPTRASNPMGLTPRGERMIDYSVHLAKRFQHKEL